MSNIGLHIMDSLTQTRREPHEDILVCMLVCMALFVATYMSDFPTEIYASHLKYHIISKMSTHN